MDKALTKLVLKGVLKGRYQLFFDKLIYSDHYLKVFISFLKRLKITQSFIQYLLFYFLKLNIVSQQNQQLLTPILQNLFMNLEVLKQYFSFLARSQLDLENSRNTLQLQRHNSFLFYRLIATKSQPNIESAQLIAFIKTFTYNFQVKQSHQLANHSNYELLPPEDNSCQEQLLSKGVELFLAQWGTSGQINFEDFCIFLKGQGEMPDRSKELEYPLKKKFYQMLEDQIQNLLDADAFRRVVGQQYKNMVDLFESIATDQEMTLQNIKNLFLQSGQRKNEVFFELISKRFPLPCDFSIFKKWFSIASASSKYKQQTKIYFSSLKRKKNQTHYDDQADDRFMTPNAKTAAMAGMSSTKMTKADRLHSMRREKVEVSRFAFEQPQSSARKNTSILGDILTEQEKVNQLKRQLIYQPDYDLELIYERRGKQFESILNNRYGSCNFTSFVRYFIPQDFEHRYLAFIKYQKENTLSEDTSLKINELLQQQELKERVIEKWWDDIDRQMIFRGYCKPSYQTLPNQQLRKYFTERECKILLDRFDPNRTGFVSLENFS